MAATRPSRSALAAAAHAHQPVIARTQAGVLEHALQDVGVPRADRIDTEIAPAQRGDRRHVFRGEKTKAPSVIHTEESEQVAAGAVRDHVVHRGHGDIDLARRELLHLCGGVGRAQQLHAHGFIAEEAALLRDEEGRIRCAAESHHSQCRFRIRERCEEREDEESRPHRRDGIL